jgi:hypothetical protein
MISEAAGVVENWMDDYIESLQCNKSAIKRNPDSIINAYKVKPFEAKEIADHLKSLLSELNYVIAGEDEDLCEGWSFLTKTKLNKFHAYVQVLVDSFDKKGTIKRRKQYIPPEKLVKNIKYLEKYNDLGRSKPPKEIINAKGVLLYNTKRKIIFLYKSKTGLTVKGTTLKNFDEFIVKNCGRKDNKWLNMMSGCPEVKLMNELNNLNAKNQTGTGRLNADTLILRIIR